MGLKLFCSIVNCDVCSSSNRTIVGLKLNISTFATSTHEGQQSHHCGIETILCECVMRVQKHGSNRTIVGLKLAFSATLKPTMLRQQSHHCGIETLFQHFYQPPSLCSNRTIVGLKLFVDEVETLNPSCSNRTIVGLKRDCETRAN